MKLFTDLNGNVTNIIPLNARETFILDGTEAAVQSEVIDGDVDRLVRVVTKVSTNIDIATTPRAQPDTILIPGGHVEWFLVPAGHKISVLGGLVNITVAR